jgi:hypothetical protein
VCGLALRTSCCIRPSAFSSSGASDMAGRAGGGGRPLRLPLNSLMAMDVVQRGVGGCIFCHTRATAMYLDHLVQKAGPHSSGQ